MKFDAFRLITDWEWIYPLPSIVFLKDEAVYVDRNFSIQFHWLGFHLRWRWVERKGE